MLAGNCFRGIGSDTSELERTWKDRLNVLCWGNRLRGRNTSPSAQLGGISVRLMGSGPLETEKNMTDEARIREEIKRKLRARLAVSGSENCDQCHKPAPVSDMTFLGSRFICRQCQVNQLSQVDRRADAVFHYPQNIAIPNCPVLRTNDCE